MKHNNQQRVWLPGLLLAILTIASGVRGAETAPDEKADNDARKFAIEGYLAAELRFRHADGDDDLDLHSHLVATARRDGAEVRVNLRLLFDLVNDQQPGDLLRDAWDNFDHDAQVRVYEAYGRLPFAERAGAVQVGRQFIDEGTYFQFDGVRLDFDFAKSGRHLEVTVFAGFTTRFRENLDSDNWLGGVVLRGFVPETKTRWRFEYFHVAERLDGFNDPVTDPAQQPVSQPGGQIEDDLVALSVWQRVGQNVRLFLRFSVLEGDPNELQLRGRWTKPDGAWNVVVEWYQLFERLFEVTNDLTPFAPTLGSYEPYYRLSARATRRVREDLILQASAAYRALEDENDEGEFNREYFNVQFNGSWLDLMEGKVDLTVTAVGYETDGDDVWAIGFHSDYRWRTNVTLSGGLDYSLYKYDWFQNTEREDVWSFTFRVRWEPKKKTRVDYGIIVDDDRFATYTTIFVKVTVRF